jgi:hypothetical protein
MAVDVAVVVIVGVSVRVGVGVAVAGMVGVSVGVTGVWVAEGTVVAVGTGVAVGSANWTEQAKVDNNSRMMGINNLYFRCISPPKYAGPLSFIQDLIIAV